MSPKPWIIALTALVALAAGEDLRAAGTEELFAGGEAAVVLAVEAPSRSDLVPFALLEIGRRISLKNSEVLRLGYQESCAVEQITGGTVTIGLMQSRVVGGTVTRGKADCALFRYQHTGPQLQAAAISVVEQHSAEALLPDHSDSVAVVIGNKTYKSRIPDVSYAHRDADAIKRYLVDVLGYRDANIIDLRDATQADMEGVLGNERSPEGRLWRYLRPGESHVTVFYSGHGVPGLKERRGYLLPVDVDPNAPEINGYPVDVLYEILARLPAKSVTVYLDACFSGDSDRSMLIRAASPVFVQPRMPERTGNLTVLTAASAEQVASCDEENEHGLFTWHLLQALQGKADDAPFGDRDGRVVVDEVRRYLDREMTYVARRRFGREQSASVQGGADVLLGIVPAVRKGPATPDTAAQALGFVIEELDQTMVVVGTAVNVRSGPGTDFGKVGRLAGETEVDVTGKVQGRNWYRIALRDGRHGYVFGKLLRDAGAGVQVAGLTARPGDRKSGPGDFGAIGASFAAVPDDVARYLATGARGGVITFDVHPDGPAASNGLRPGDIVVAIDGQPVSAPDALAAASENRRPGDIVFLSFYRGDVRQEAQILIRHRQVASLPIADDALRVDTALLHPYLRALVRHIDDQAEDYGVEYLRVARLAAILEDGETFEDTFQKGVERIGDGDVTWDLDLAVEALLSAGQTERALRFAETQPTAERYHDTMRSIGWSLARRGDVRGAESILEMIDGSGRNITLDHSPGEAASLHEIYNHTTWKSIRSRIASAQAKAGNRRAALNVLQEMEDVADRSEVVLEIARSDAGKGRTDEADALLSAVFQEASKTTGSTRARSFRALAQGWAAIGRGGNAINLLRDRVFEEEASHLSETANGIANMGEIQTAVALLPLLKSDKDRQMLQYFIMLAKAETGDLDGAMALAQQLDGAPNLMRVYLKHAKVPARRARHRDAALDLSIAWCLARTMDTERARVWERSQVAAGYAELGYPQYMNLVLQEALQIAAKIPNSESRYLWVAVNGLVEPHLKAARGSR